MLKKLMIGTALTAFAVSGAMAQSSPPAPASSDPPAMQSQSPGASPSAPAATKPVETTGQQTQTTGGDKIVASQKPTQWLASKFQGTDVIGSDGKKIGDVNDVLFDQSGQIQAYVVGVGGFLGVGSKNVALAPNAFQVVKGDGQNSSDKLKLAMSQDELKAAPAFEPYREAARSTTGSGPGSRPGGGLGAPRPPSNSGPASK